MSEDLAQRHNSCTEGINTQECASKEGNPHVEGINTQKCASTADIEFHLIRVRCYNH